MNTYEDVVIVIAPNITAFWEYIKQADMESGYYHFMEMGSNKIVGTRPKEVHILITSDAEMRWLSMVWFESLIRLHFPTKFIHVTDDGYYKRWSTHPKRLDSDTYCIHCGHLKSNHNTEHKIDLQKGHHTTVKGCDVCGCNNFFPDMG